MEMCPHNAPLTEVDIRESVPLLCHYVTKLSPASLLSRVLKSLSFPPELQLKRFEVASSDKHPTAAESCLLAVGEKRMEELLCYPSGKPVSLSSPRAASLPNAAR